MKKETRGTRVYTNGARVNSFRAHGTRVNRGNTLNNAVIGIVTDSRASLLERYSYPGTYLGLPLVGTRAILSLFSPFFFFWNKNAQQPSENEITTSASS